MLLSFCHQKINVRTSLDVDDLVMGMASQIMEKVDNIVVEDLRGNESVSLRVLLDVSIAY